MFKLNLKFKRFVVVVTTLLVVLISNQMFAQTSTSWKGITSTAWATSSNWTNGVPSSTISAVIGDASFTGSYQPSITATSTVLDLTIGNSSIASTLTCTKKLTVYGNLLIGSNGTFAFNNTSTSNPLTCKGNFTNNGSFTTVSTSAIVKMGGTSQSISGSSSTTFRRLTINSGSTTSLSQNITVSYAFVVTGTFDPGEPASVVTISGSTFTLSANCVLYVKAATFTANYSIVPSSTSGTSIIEYGASTVNQTINSSITYGILKISGAMTKSLTANLPNLSSSTSGGKLYVNGGTFDMSSYTANRAASGGSFTVANGATLKIGGTNTFPSNYSSHSIGASSTIEYSGTAQTVSNETYGNLKLSSSSGAATKTMPSASLTISGNFRTNVGSGTSVSVTAAGALTIGNGLTIGSSTTFNASSYSHTITGSIQNDGTLTGSTSTITLNGASAAISGAGTSNYYNLTITAAGVTVASTTNFNVDGNLSTTGSGTLTHTSGSTGTLTMAGASKTISGSSISLNNVSISGSVSTTSNLTIAGDLTVNGTFTNSSNTVTLSGTSKSITGSGTETISAMVVSGTYTTTKTFSISADLTVSGSFTASSGTITFNGTSTLSGTANLYNVTINGTSLTMGGSANLGIANTFTITSGTFNVTSNTPNTVTFNGSGAQTVNAGTYYKLVLSTGGTKTAAGAITLNGNFQIDASVTFAAGSYTHTFTRDFTNNGTFTAGTSTASFTGTIDATISGATTFNIITVNKSSASNVITINNDCSAVTVNMTSGEIHTGSATLTMSSGRTGTGIILGIIKRTNAFTTGVAYEFEGPYNTITFSSVSSVTSITVTALNAPVSDYPFGGSVNREYDFAIPSGTYTASIKLHYNDADINGNVESTMNIWRYGGSTWYDSSKTTNSTTNNYVQKDGLTNLVGRWTMSDDVNAVQWTGAVSTAWEVAGNWSVIAGSANVPPTATDIVELGSGTFTNQPVITTAVTVRGITFNSPTPVTTTIAAGGSLTSNGNLNGNIAGNWSLGNATHNFNVGAQTMNVGGSLVLSDGTVGHAININISTGTVNVTGSLTQSGSANVIFSGSGTLNIGGDYNYTNGTFTCSTGTVNYNGTSTQVIAPLYYYNLTMNKTAGVSTSSLPVHVTNNLTLSTAAFYQTNDSLVVTKDITINSGTTLKGNTAYILVGGNWVNSGTFTPSSSTVIFNGAAGQSLNATTFNNLTINKSAGTVTPSGNLTINGNLSLTNGTLDLGTYTANRSATGGTFTISNSSNLKIAGASNFPSSYTTNTVSSGSTVEYNGTVAQTVNAITYGNLTFSNGGATAKTLSGTTAVAGNFLINSGATLSASSYALNVAGNWTNSGTFTPATSTVTLSGVSKTFTGTTTFNALIISGSYTSSNNITVSGATTLSGSLSSGSTTVTLAGNFTNTGTLTNSGTITFSGTGAQALQINSGLSTTGTVNFNGTVAPTITSTSNPVFYNLNLNNTGGITPASDWRVNNTAVIASGVTFAGGANTHTFYGAFTNNGTVTSSDTFNFTPASTVTVALMGSGFTSTGCVNFGGAGAITVTGTPTSVENILISNTNAAGITLPTSWTINGNLTTLVGTTLNLGTALSHTLNGTLDCGGTLDGGTSTLTMNGTAEQLQGTGDIALYNFTIASGATITVINDYQIKKDFTNNGTYDATGFMTEFIGALASSITGTTTPSTIDYLTVTKTAATVTVNVNLSNLTQIFVNSGTLDVSNKTISQDVSGGDLDIEAGATLKVGGTNNIPTFNTYTIASSGTVEFNGSNQSISSTPTYGNLTLSAAGNKTPAGALTMAGNFLLSAGTFVSGNYTHSIGGNWTMSGGTFTNTNTTIAFNGTGSQTLSSTGSFNNLTMNKSSGSFTLLTDVTVNGTLTFTSGNITTSSYKVILPSGSSVSRTSGHVVGNMQKYFNSTASKTFEIGDATSGYAPVAIAFSSISSNGNLIASTTYGDHTDITNSSVNASKSVNRYYTLTNSGIGFTNYSATFNFLSGDIDAGASTSSFIVANRPSSTWTFPTVGTKTATSTQCTGNTTFGDFQVGEYGQKLWDGGASTTNWGDANNWNPNGVPTTTENVVLNAAATIDINVAAVCKDLTISHASVTLTIQATRSLSASGDFSMSAGTLNTAASYPTITGSTSLTGGTIGYTLGGAQTVVAINYYNLTLATSGAKTFASGTVGIANTFSLTGTATVNASTNSATLNLIGTAPQTLTSNGATFYNLTMSNSSGVTLADNCTVSNVLSLTSGIIATGSNRIICTSTSAGAVTNQSSSSYINGNLRRYIANNTSTYAFPVGTASAYTLEELINNNLAGITYIDASFGAKPGNDVGINVWENGTYYTSVNSFGVWYLTPNANPSSGTYDLKCYTNAFSGLADNAFGILSRPDASSNAAQWIKAGGTLNATNGLGRLVSDGYALRKGLTSFSQKGIGQAGQGLPIELTAFDVTKENQNAILNWTTASEMNNNHFEIESGVTDATGNLSFSKIGEVAGMGTTTIETHYQFTDEKNNFSGIVYYRLKQVDANGEFTYSAIKSVEFAALPFTVSDFYPNPTGDNFSFEINSASVTAITVQVISSLGQLVMQKSIAAQQGLNNMKMNIEKLPEGLYFVEITDQNNATILQRKIMKMQHCCFH